MGCPRPTHAVDRLEVAEVAHIAARLAWLFPADAEAQQAATDALRALPGCRDMDYLDLVTRKLTESDTSHDGAPADPALILDMDDARRAVAEDLRRVAERVYSGEAC